MLIYTYPYIYCTYPYIYLSLYILILIGTQMSRCNASALSSEEVRVPSSHRDHPLVTANTKAIP